MFCVWLLAVNIIGRVGGGRGGRRSRIRGRDSVLEGENTLLNGPLAFPLQAGRGR